MADYVRVGEMEMTTREYKMLKFIIEFISTDALRQPPSHREVVEALNKAGERIISTEQTMRVAYTLRKKKLLVEIEPTSILRRNRNLVPTPLALRIMKKDAVPV